MSGLAIISRSSSLALKGKSEDAKVIGKKLGVSHALEGSVRKAGNRVRISVQLTNTSDGYQLWSETYERQLENIFDVQDEIAKIVVNRMKENLDISQARGQVSQKDVERHWQMAKR